jgi:phage baseplate assembly protein gpV
MANGFYIGGFLNNPPSTFIELKQSGEIIITAPAGLTINGNISVNGSQNLSGDCVASGISLVNHIHTGDSGGQTSHPIG